MSSKGRHMLIIMGDVDDNVLPIDQLATFVIFKHWNKNECLKMKKVICPLAGDKSGGYFCPLNLNDFVHLCPISLEMLSFSACFKI